MLSNTGLILTLLRIERSNLPCGGGGSDCIDMHFLFLSSLTKYQERKVRKHTIEGVCRRVCD